MNRKFSTAHAKLSQIANAYNRESTLLKSALLGELYNMALPGGQALLAYHDLLLFLCAYPDNRAIQRLAEKGLRRIALYAKQHKGNDAVVPENEGLPFANTVTRFSPDFLRWLDGHKDLKVAFDSFYNPSLNLNAILNITLPATLKAETTAGLGNEALLEVLHIKPNEYVPFILGQLEQLRELPILKELLIERMDLYVKLVPQNGQFSRAYNRVPVTQAYYHQDLLKQFDADQLINQPLAATRFPAAEEQQTLYKVIRNAMALTVREIDPATFLQMDTIRLYDLERGLTLSVYSMLPPHQLPLETYFGFTFFKNGIPISYGGIWAFGAMAKIGLNIFEPFRGGESGYILCQLMRVMKQALGVTYVEMEPYQYGLDNPGGIASGAFWFYYKYGFRPVDSELRELAQREYHKIKSRNNYRSTEKTLLRFTESNIGVNLGSKVPLSVPDITDKIRLAIKKDWHHNYAAAKQQAIGQFCNKVQLDTDKLDADARKVLEDMALWAMALKVQKPLQLQLMKQMVLTKTKDDYAYQQLLLDFFQL
jgi:hypothetical protein